MLSDFCLLSLSTKSVRLIHYAVRPDLGPSTRLAVSGFMSHKGFPRDEPEESPGRLSDWWFSLPDHFEYLGETCMSILGQEQSDHA